MHEDLQGMRQPPGLEQLKGVAAAVCQASRTRTRRKLRSWYLFRLRSLCCDNTTVTTAAGVGNSVRVQELVRTGVIRPTGTSGSSNQQAYRHDRTIIARGTHHVGEECESRPNLQQARAAEAQTDFVGLGLWMSSISALRGAVQGMCAWISKGSDITDMSEACKVNAFQFVWSDLRSSKRPFGVRILCAVVRCCKA